MMYIAPQECLFGPVKTLSCPSPAELKIFQEHNSLIRRHCLFYFEKRQEESRDLAGIWCEGVFVLFLWFGFFPLRSYVVGTYL